MRAFQAFSALGCDRAEGQLLRARDEVVERGPDSAASVPARVAGAEGAATVFSKRPTALFAEVVGRRGYRLREAGLPRPKTEVR